jgi:predicted nucleotidyltransferase
VTNAKEVKEGQYDCVFYEIRKMFSLLLQGNPNVVSLLWLRPKDYLVVTKPARLILQNRDLFAGKHVYDAFSGYARRQLTKMETRDPAELRVCLAFTYEAKFRGIHPNNKGVRVEYPEGYILTPARRGTLLPTATPRYWPASEPT